MIVKAAFGYLNLLYKLPLQQLLCETNVVRN
ncbi:UNVERIFIED_ORG: hypothetical protein GGI61_002255 [Rhizobium esperanzae]